MDTVKTYLLKRRIPIDSHSGFDMRFMRLCPFIDEVFYVQDREESTSGKQIVAECQWPSTQINGFDGIEPHLESRRDSVWIAADYASFLALRRFGVQKIIYDSCDSESLYFLRRFKVLPWKKWKKKLNSIRQWAQWAYRERMVIRNCKAIVVPALKDKESFLRRGNGMVEVITNGTAWVDQPPISREDDARALMFHGVFSWEVNETTAEFLASQIYPAVKALIPDCEVRIAGNPVPPGLKRFAEAEGVFLEGFVDNIREWLSGCAVYVMPMFQGGGVKNKLLEAMAAGLPVVTNSMGAEAMPLDSRQGFVVADGLDNMVAAVVELCRNRTKAAELSGRARSYALEHFKWEPLASLYKDLVVEVASG